MRFAAFILFALVPLTPALALTPATDFDLNRYVGTWYEFASIPGFLQSKCARDTRAESIVIAVGPDYKWIALGHPSLRYARILSRSPALPDDAVKNAAAALAAQQFDLCALVTTSQSAGRATSGRLCDIIK